MIPRYQRILFWSLANAILLMALFLLHGCAQAREKLTRHRDATPLAAPIATPTEAVTLALASDADGSIVPVERRLALPVETTSRARALLARLIFEYSLKNSAHPLESGPAVDDVFLLDLPLRPPAPAAPPPPDTKRSRNSADAPPPALAKTVSRTGSSGPKPGEVKSAGSKSPEPAAATPPPGQLAVVNLHGTFADRHPSGVGVECLTIESIVATLHANLPRIQQVRFLVDGAPRETLNGHADLLRTYPVTASLPVAMTPPAEPAKEPLNQSRF